MQRMQRKVGAFLPRTADDHQVGMLIADFNAADKMLETLISASKTWQDSWNSILNHQSAMLADYELLYGPIIGQDSAEGKYTETPQDKLESVHGLKDGYVELKNEMLEEIAMIEKQIMAPAKDARRSVAAYKKVIKKREDKKLDYERYKSRTEKLEGKAMRSERENTALGKHQIDYTSAKAAYEAADDHLKQTLPGMTHATYSLLPHLLNAQIMIQNTLLAQLYTTLHTYCNDFSIDSNPPEADQIIATFKADFDALRIELESGIMTIARGKAVKEPMGGSDKSKSYSGVHIRDRIQEKRNPLNKPAPQRPIGAPRWHSEDNNNGQPPSPPAASGGAETPPQISMATRPKITSIVSNTSVKSNGSLVANPPGHYLSPSEFSHRTPSPGTALGQRNDYFGDPLARKSSAVSIASSATSLQSAASGKKKPPPPPPPKKKPSMQFEYVTALYDYSGQEGDLSFREGERIKIVKKTDSRNDWWEGEVNGRRGSFPANYCE